MRKPFLLTLALMIPLLSAGSCGARKVCEPFSVREEPGHYYVCNDHGTGEERHDSPRAN